MKPIEEHLEFLYGRDAAGPIFSQIQSLLVEHRRLVGGPRHPRQSLGLTQKDALLITYADQVKEPGASPLATLGGFMEAHLRDVVCGVHVLPFYPSSSDDGFAVIDWWAVDPVFGTWADIERLKGSFALMFDAVFNHVSASNSWFQRFLAGDEHFHDFFITVEGEPDLSSVVRPRALPLLTEFPTSSGNRKVWTTFSADQVDLNFKNPDVLLAALRALLFYAGKGARFIRLDAIAYLWKEPGTTCIHLPQTHRIIQLMRSVLDEAAPGVLLITETNVPHADNLSYFGDGANEAQLVYNFALPPLVLHSLATGNARRLTDWASALRLPSGSVTFFNFLASHDGIGLNPARGILSPAEIDALVARTLAHGGFVSYKQNADGSRSPYELNINFFDAVSDPGNREEPIDTQVARFLAGQAIMLALAGVPGIYFHSLFGSRNDRAAAETGGIPRRINRQKLARAELEATLADPPTLRARVFGLYKELLRVRSQYSAFHPSGSQEILNADERVFAVLRHAPHSAEPALCLHNVSNERVALDLPLPQAMHPAVWRDLLTNRVCARSDGGVVEITLEPYQVFWGA